MKQPLTPGRWRGLMTTSTAEQVFTILAFDQRGSYRKLLRDNLPYTDAVQIKTEVVSTLSTQTSAVLLDHEYGLSSALQISGQSGLLLALEKSGYSGDSTYRRIEFLDDWTVEKIKRFGASAVKMMVYYHPAQQELSDELDGIVSNVIQKCHQTDVLLFLEPMSYSVDSKVDKSSQAFAESRQEVIIETARRLSKLKPDVLKMEFPIDAKFESNREVWQSSCEKLSSVCAVPWVLLSAGVDFEIFKDQVEVACSAGASGYLAGRAIWKESINMKPAERQHFLETVALSRVQQLNAIAHKLARPWTDFYSLPDIHQTWFKDYT